MTQVTIQLLDNQPAETSPYSFDRSQGSGLPLPDSRVLAAAIPRFDTWSTLADPNDLFRQLGIEAFFQLAGPFASLSLSAHECWHGLLQTAAFHGVFVPMLQSMGWYGAAPDEQASPRITQALAGRAIVDHFLGTMDGSREPMARVLRRKWIYNYSHLELREVIRRQVEARYPQAWPATLGMLEYLLLRESLPELLVEGVPDCLQYGRSLQSVALIHGVALVEAMVPGSSVRVGYDELVKVSATLARSRESVIQALWARAWGGPALHQAIAHGVIECPDDDRGQASAVQVDQASDYLKKQQNAHAREMNDLLRLKAPDRQALAEDMLRQAGVAERMWRFSGDSLGTQGTHVLEEHGFTIAWTYLFDRLKAAGRPQATLIELVMMGEACVAAKPTIQEQYEHAWQVYETALVKAMATVMVRLFSEMQPGQRSELLQSTCEVSRVRFDGVEGAQGLFIRCQPGDQRATFQAHSAGPEVFFEVFPAAGVVRRVVQRFDYHPAHHFVDSINLAELFRQKQRNEQRDARALITPLQPFDSDAYLGGWVSRTVQNVHTPRHGVLIPAPERLYLSDTGESEAIAVLASSAARHLVAGVMQQSKIEHQHLTLWEQVWDRERVWADTAARWCVPFYGCIKDLSAGEHSAGVVTECVMDAAFALVPLGQFVGATTRLMWRAGELSVLSLARLTGVATGHLLTGVAEQSAVFMVGDAGKWLLKAGKPLGSALLHELPGLKTLFSSTDTLAEPVGQVAIVDGKPATAVMNVGTSGAADFRLLDRFSGQAYGGRLTAISFAGGMEFSTLPVSERIVPGYYPDVLPLLRLEDGRHQAAIARDCQVRVIERQTGMTDVLIDRETYCLDRHEPDPALRKLARVPLSPQVTPLAALERICRVRRDLVPVDCANGIRLVTPAPVLPDQEVLLPGHHYSHAMAARAFGLATLTDTTGLSAADLSAFVHEGKICKWGRSTEAGPSASVSAASGQVLPVDEIDRLIYDLPDEVRYLEQFRGQRVDEPLFGLMPSATGLDLEAFNRQAPVIELGSLAQGIHDGRTLRGIQLEYAGRQWICIEPDRGRFYKAVPDVHTLQFEAMPPGDPVLDEYLMQAEQYRQVRETPGIWQDRQNIARLLFDMLDETERASLPEADMTFEQYAAACKARHQPNPFLEYASRILAGKSFQNAYIELARQTVPDFKMITERSALEVGSIVEILNNLLPARSSRQKWVRLDAENIMQEATINRIRKQVHGANLAFASVHSEGRQRYVYFAVSGGKLGDKVQLKPEGAFGTDAYINHVFYNCARPGPGELMDPSAYRIPEDPRFTTLPTVRHADQLTVRAIDRSLDSERLIGTMIKDELGHEASKITRIDFFTLLDACRSCGGFALPRLKHDFPDAAFSVTYLKPYKDD